MAAPPLQPLPGLPPPAPLVMPTNDADIDEIPTTARPGGLAKLRMTPELQIAARRAGVDLDEYFRVRGL